MQSIIVSNAIVHRIIVYNIIVHRIIVHNAIVHSIIRLFSSYNRKKKRSNSTLRYECDETYEILYPEVWKCGFPHAKRA